MTAILFAQSRGVYFQILGLDVYDAARDARSFNGPGPVVAHPPCARWGRYARGNHDDGGLFYLAFFCVRLYGGVIEHPAGSAAWKAFGISMPPRVGGWVPADAGWTCCVDQGHYGFPSPKATWLYLSGKKPAPLIWGPSLATGRVENLSHRQREATSREFADLLIRMVQ